MSALSPLIREPLEVGSGLVVPTDLDGFMAEMEYAFPDTDSEDNDMILAGIQEGVHQRFNLACVPFVLPVDETILGGGILNYVDTEVAESGSVIRHSVVTALFRSRQCAELLPRSLKVSPLLLGATFGSLRADIATREVNHPNDGFSLELVPVNEKLRLLYSRLGFNNRAGLATMQLTDVIALHHAFSVQNEALLRHLQVL